MEYFYSISGLIINVLIWSLVLFFIDKAIQTMIGKISKPKPVRIFYNIIIGLMLGFTTLNIAINSLMIGYGFEKELNYWYWDIDQGAKDWGMTCKGEMITFKK